MLVSHQAGLLVQRLAVHGPALPAVRGPALPAVRGPGLPAVRGPGLPAVRGPGLPAVRGPGLSAVRGPGLSAVCGPGLPAVRGPGLPAVRGPGAACCARAGAACCARAGAGGWNEPIVKVGRVPALVPYATPNSSSKRHVLRSAPVFELLSIVAFHVRFSCLNLFMAWVTVHLTRSSVSFLCISFQRTEWDFEDTNCDSISRRNVTSALVCSLFQCFTVSGVAGKLTEVYERTEDYLLNANTSISSAITECDTFYFFNYAVIHIIV